MTRYDALCIMRIMKHVAETPDAIDRHVGERLRFYRRLRRLSQEALAQRAGVTFQQIQKYELGQNRIAAGRLYRLACALGLPPSEFFPDTPLTVDTMDALVLRADYLSIRDAEVRGSVRTIVRTLARAGTER